MAGAPHARKTRGEDVHGRHGDRGHRRKAHEADEHREVLGGQPPVQEARDWLREKEQRERTGNGENEAQSQRAEGAASAALPIAAGDGA